MFLKRLPLGSMQTNCYILADEDTKECAIFDPSAEPDRIMSVVEENGFDVKYIILTHVHADHVMALDKVKRLTDADIVAHRCDAEMLNDNGYTLSNLFFTSAPQSKANVVAEDGDTLTIGNLKLRFIHTPGHTLGGMCILCGDTLISGDTLFAGSVGRTDFPGGDHKKLIDSIKDKLMVLDDDINVYPGHGPSTTIGYERENNPYLESL